MTWHVVVGDYPPAFTGGVASWTERVCLGLHARGLPVVLHARGARALGRVDEARYDAAQPYAIQRVRVRRWNRNQSRAAAAALAPCLEPGDRVLATTWPLAPGLVEPCRELGLSLVVVAHGSAITRLAAAPPELRVLAGYARFAAVSRFLAARLEALGIEARVLPSPVDVQDPGPGGRRGLLAVARCTPLKGLERVLALGEALGWPVTVVGEGPVLSDLRRRAEDSRVPVHFEGRLSTSACAERYRRARLLAQLSRVDADGSGAEGLGLVVLEAIAHGVPAVVSPVGGLPEAVGPGLVLPRPDDAPDSAHRIRDWLAGGDRIAEQRAWLEAEHGTPRTLDALLDMVQDPAP